MDVLAEPVVSRGAAAGNACFMRLRPFPCTPEVRGTCAEGDRPEQSRNAFRYSRTGCLKGARNSCIMWS